MKKEQDDEDHETKHDLARGVVTELEEEGGVRGNTYPFESWFAHDSGLVEHVES